jgi:hypothetical protein
MISLSRICERSSRNGGNGEGSIREVSLLSTEVVSQVRSEGDAFDWAGRTYQVEALDHGGYLHVRPVESTRSS